MATGGSSANINKFEATMVVTSSLINDDVTATIMIVAVAAATGHLQYSSSHSHGSLVLCALTSDLTSADQQSTVHALQVSVHHAAAAAAALSAAVDHVLIYC